MIEDVASKRTRAYRGRGKHHPHEAVTSRFPIYQMAIGQDYLARFLLPVEIVGMHAGGCAKARPIPLRAGSFFFSFSLLASHFPSSCECLSAVGKYNKSNAPHSPYCLFQNQKSRWIYQEVGEENPARSLVATSQIYFGRLLETVGKFGCQITIPGRSSHIQT